MRNSQTEKNQKPPQDISLYQIYEQIKKQEDTINQISKEVQAQKEMLNNMNQLMEQRQLLLNSPLSIIDKLDLDVEKLGKIALFICSLYSSSDKTKDETK